MSTIFRASTRPRRSEGRSLGAIGQRGGRSCPRSRSPSEVSERKSCSSPAALGGPELAQRHAAGEGGAADGLGLGLGDQPVRRSPSPRSRRRQGARRARSGSGLRTSVPVAGEQLVLGAGGDEAGPAVDQQQLVGDRLDLVAAGARRAGRCRRGRRIRGAARRIQMMPSGSSPLAGSSRIRTSGSPSRTWARPRRCRMPSEYLPTRRFAAVRSSPTRVSISSTRLGSAPIVSAQSRRVSRPRRPGCWALASSITPTWRAGLAIRR